MNFRIKQYLFPETLQKMRTRVKPGLLGVRTCAVQPVHLQFGCCAETFTGVRIFSWVHSENVISYVVRQTECPVIQLTKARVVKSDDLVQYVSIVGLCTMPISIVIARNSFISSTVVGVHFTVCYIVYCLMYGNVLACLLSV